MKKMDAVTNQSFILVLIIYEILHLVLMYSVVPFHLDREYEISYNYMYIGLQQFYDLLQILLLCLMLLHE
jgi:hypothetical protein